MAQTGIGEGGDLEETGIDATARGLRDSVRTMMEQHWVEAGYTAPNSTVYPWLWLWDSCFHSLIWLELGAPDRALAELESLLAAQAESGFVPHISDVLDPVASHDFWGRRGASSITQPPMFGHVLAELSRRGVEVPEELVSRAHAGLRFLLRDRRRDPSGLLLLVHPWESGADDSPRWDSLCPGGYGPAAWYDAKGAWVRSIVASTSGAPVANPEFAVASVGFNALVAFNALEMASLGGSGDLADGAAELGEALAARWDPELQTWLDAGATEGGSGAVRTLDALLPSLIDADRTRTESVGRLLIDPAAYGGPYGPTGVHRHEPAFDPQAYWRGPAWPQLTYLLALAQTRAGNIGAAADLGRCLVAGAAASGLAEYWDPDRGSGLGAVPQSWAGLALLAPGQ
jgi:hypothetical protein